MNDLDALLDLVVDAKKRALEGLRQQKSSSLYAAMDYMTRELAAQYAGEHHAYERVEKILRVVIAGDS